MNVKSELFSSKARTNLIQAGVTRGTLIFAVASGDDYKGRLGKACGLLSIWQAIKEPVRSTLTREEVQIYPLDEQDDRMKLQWRVSVWRDLYRDLAIPDS